MKDRRPTTADPTPEEIRERCLEIQATWSPQEEQRRRGIRVLDKITEAYEIPQGVQSPVQ